MPVCGIAFVFDSSDAQSAEADLELTLQGLGLLTVFINATVSRTDDVALEAWRRREIVAAMEQVIRRDSRAVNAIRNPHDDSVNGEDKIEAAENEDDAVAKTDTNTELLKVDEALDDGTTTEQHERMFEQENTADGEQLADVEGKKTEGAIAPKTKPEQADSQANTDMASNKKIMIEDNVGETESVRDDDTSTVGAVEGSQQNEPTSEIIGANLKEDQRSSEQEQDGRLEPATPSPDSYIQQATNHNIERTQGIENAPATAETKRSTKSSSRTLPSPTLTEQRDQVAILPAPDSLPDKVRRRRKKKRKHAVREDIRTEEDTEHRELKSGKPEPSTARDDERRYHKDFKLRLPRWFKAVLT